MLHTLLSALWFQDKHATQVLYAAGNLSIKMAAGYILGQKKTRHIKIKNIAR